MLPSVLAFTLKEANVQVNVYFKVEVFLLSLIVRDIRGFVYEETNLYPPDRRTNYLSIPQRIHIDISELHRNYPKFTIPYALMFW